MNGRRDYRTHIHVTTRCGQCGRPWLDCECDNDKGAR